MGSQVATAVLQTLQFLLVARTLGAHEFGIVASVVAITSVLLPFSSLCLGNVAIVRIARAQDSADTSLGNGLAVTTVTAIIGIGIALIAGNHFLIEPDIWIVVVLFAVSELVLTKYIDFAVHIFLAKDQHGIAALPFNLLWVVRLVCATALWAGLTEPTALAWAQLHLAAGVVTAVFVLYLSVRLIGFPRVHLETAVKDMKVGVFFSVATAAGNLQADVDKIVLARLESASIAGAYTAAFRVLYMACVPVLAILFAVRSRLYRKGHHGGVSGALGALSGIIPLTGAYSLVAAGAIYLASPALPWLLGPSYQLSSQVLQALCLLPVLSAIRQVCGEALVGADEHRRLSFMFAAAAALSLLLNLALVPMYGWTGAVAAAYLAQLCIVAGLLMMIARKRRAERMLPGAASMPKSRTS